MPRERTQRSGLPAMRRLAAAEGRAVRAVPGLFKLARLRIHASQPRSLSVGFTRRSTVGPLKLEKPLGDEENGHGKPTLETRPDRNSNTAISTIRPSWYFLNETREPQFTKDHEGQPGGGLCFHQVFEKEELRF